MQRKLDRKTDLLQVTDKNISYSWCKTRFQKKLFLRVPPRWLHLAPVFGTLPVRGPLLIRWFTSLIHLCGPSITIHICSRMDGSCKCARLLDWCLCIIWGDVVFRVTFKLHLLPCPPSIVLVPLGPPVLLKTMSCWSSVGFSELWDLLVQFLL